MSTSSRPEQASSDTVIRKFEHRPGVIDLGVPESWFKRRYCVLRMPRETLRSFVVESRVPDLGGQLRDKSVNLLTILDQPLLTAAYYRAKFRVKES